MKGPLVSICLPNLNCRPFLAERLETIFAQTYSDWELVVSDNFSEDGAWEYFRAEASREPRMRISQAAREGMYPNWNNCLRLARGKYIYIATSDDTMPADLLQKLVSAMEEHPECDLAHCKLRAFGENGPQTTAWWSRKSTFALSSGELIDLPHIRRAPFDGLLHLLGDTVYTSITQLLIRRSLFARIGLFESRWGSIGDFNWDMRAALVAHTIHVPDTWGGWRKHADQATARANLGSAEHRAKIDEMICEAIKSCDAFLTPEIRKPLQSRWTARTSELRTFLPALQACKGAAKRRMFLASQLLSGSWAARQHIKSRLRGLPPLSQSAPNMIQTWLERSCVGPVLVPT